MQKFVISEREKEQRLDKYLKRRLSAAPSSFIYKMLRKKNITLNGTRAQGSELLQTGDTVCLFFSDETFAKFSGSSGTSAENSSGNGKGSDFMTSCTEVYRRISALYRTPAVLYEDSDVLFADKLPGILSQKAAEKDQSMNEWLVGYLLQKKELDEDRLREFRPSVCNRLDRNTGGILICAKTLQGSHKMTELLRSRDLKKFYQMTVKGRILKPGHISGWLLKDEATNTVTMIDPDSSDKGDAVFSETDYRPIETGKRLTLLEAELLTGRTHQLRAHLSSIGHPIAGDAKYGDPVLNREMLERYRIRGQMLYCCRLELPKMEGEWERLSGKIIEVPAPPVYYEAVRNLS
jgi:23S rRNA pseudouridine955/2504/2580 synthase